MQFKMHRHTYGLIFVILATISLLTISLWEGVDAQQPIPVKDGLAREHVKTTADKKQAVEKTKQEQQQQQQQTSQKASSVKNQLIVKQAELSISDSDQDRAVRTLKLDYPAPLAEKLSLAEHDKLVVLFRLQSSSSGAAASSTTVNQVFLRLSHVEQPQHEVFAIAEPESSGLYKADLQMNTMRDDFKAINGLYTLALDIGDANAERSLTWTLGQVQVEFSGAAAAAATTLNARTDFKLRPEIKHTFRVPEKRPPAMVTTAFLVLTIVPLGVLLILWARLGVNLSNFPLTLPSLVFFGSLCAIFGLYFMFWTKLNMFQTLNWLALLGTVAFVSGGMMLRSIAARRVKQE